MRTNYLLLLTILLGLIPMNYTHASDSVPSVFLYSPYTKISVSPGTSIDYKIDLINNSDAPVNADLSVTGLPASWKRELKSGGWNIQPSGTYFSADQRYHRNICRPGCRRLLRSGNSGKHKSNLY